MYKEVARWPAASRVLAVLGIGLLSLPLAFVLWLLLAVRMPQMDSMTRAMPSGVREAVANEVLSHAGYGKKGMAEVHRVLAFDADNTDAWDRVCGWDRATEKNAKGLKECMKALSLHDYSVNWSNVGEIQEAMGDECAAADAYNHASNEGSSELYYGYVEDFGRASLRCGKAVYDANAGLLAAVDLETKTLAKPDDMDDEDIQETKNDMRDDREYLIVAQEELHQSDNARKTCSEVHADWKACACSLDKKGQVHCEEQR